MKTVLTRFLALALLWTLSAASADAACWQWSKTAASNATADPSINWAEGMAPSSVNNSARAMMARLAECRDDLSGLLLSTGTSTAYAVTSNQGTIASTPGDGQGLTFRPNVTNGASPTLAVDGGTAYPIQSSPGTAVASGVLVQGTPYRVTFSTTSSAWLLNDFYNTTVAAGSIVTSMLADSAVTYAKIQNVTNNRLLGNFSGGAAAPSEYAITGAGVSGSTIAIPYPPPGASFKNLVIKVTGNTTVSATADFVVTTDGTNFQTTAVNCTTINFGTTGINALDFGTVATSSWYAIWVMVKADGTTGCTASLQGSANPTFLSHLPSGYTFYGRVGWVRTDSSVAQLMGTWQFGRQARYVVGLAKTTLLPIMDSGAKGTYSISSPSWSAVSVSNFVPTTAASVSFMGVIRYNSGANGGILVAPSSGYSGPSSTNPPPYANNIGDITTGAYTHWVAPMMLESTNIYWASESAGAALMCYGWEDNL